MVAVAAGLVVEGLKGFPVSRWIGNLAASVWGVMTSRIAVPVWLLIVMIVLALAFVAAIIVRLRAPRWQTYRRDSFLEIVWHWDYVYDELATSTLTPICPKCSYRMTIVNAAAYVAAPRIRLQCDDCGYARDFAGSWQDLMQRVVNLIDRKVRTGDFAKALPLH